METEPPGDTNLQGQVHVPEALCPGVVVDVASGTAAERLQREKLEYNDRGRIHPGGGGLQGIHSRNRSVTIFFGRTREFHAIAGPRDLLLRRLVQARERILREGARQGEPAVHRRVEHVVQANRR